MNRQAVYKHPSTLKIVCESSLHKTLPYNVSFMFHCWKNCRLTWNWATWVYTHWVDLNAPCCMIMSIVRKQAWYMHEALLSILRHAVFYKGQTISLYAACSLYCKLIAPSTLRESEYMMDVSMQYTTGDVKKQVQSFKRISHVIGTADYQVLTSCCPASKRWRRREGQHRQRNWIECHCILGSSSMWSRTCQSRSWPVQRYSFLCSS